MSIFLILLAAGDSKRLKTRVPKPFLVVNNKTLLEHSLNAFKDFPEIKKKIIVYKKQHKKYIDNLYLKNILKVYGGKNRQESTFKALKKIKKMRCTKVLIHDAARPNISKKLISKIIYKLKKKSIVIPIIKSNDAVKRTKNSIVFKNINRDGLSFAQTPQGFDFKKLYKKHYENIDKSFDDDSSLFTNHNEKIFTTYGSKENLKITDKEDLNIFKSFKKTKIYTGIGFDVHRLERNRKLYLGGINIKSKLGTLGHSDGDPVLHAITDAILGACNMGDIGEKFSNKDRIFKNIRSTILLKLVINQVNSKNYFVNNLDINIITQSPKIQKYKKKLLIVFLNYVKFSQIKLILKAKQLKNLV